MLTLKTIRLCCALKTYFRQQKIIQDNTCSHTECLAGWSRLFMDFGGSWVLSGCYATSEESAQVYQIQVEKQQKCELGTSLIPVWTSIYISNVGNQTLWTGNLIFGFSRQLTPWQTSWSQTLLGSLCLHKWNHEVHLKDKPNYLYRVCNP